MEEKDERTEEAKTLEKLLGECLDKGKTLKGANVFLVGAIPCGVRNEEGEEAHTVVAGMFGKVPDIHQMLCNVLSKNMEWTYLLLDAITAVLEKEKRNPKNI